MAKNPVLIDLALQGGGAHGAFTWGVIDRLLDEEWIDVEAISGASAGAMNAVVLAHGLIDGGRPGAKAALANFWRRIAESAPMSSLTTMTEFFDPERRMTMTPSGWWSPTVGLEVSQTVFSGLFSPYQFNPLNFNPLLALLDELVDFEAIRQSEKIKVLVSATRVSDGELRLFRNNDISARAVMASACLPELFHAVQIDGESHWDGGYIANPALEPLIKESAANDLLLVQLNPPTRAQEPFSAKEIANRLNEITFNANLNQALHLIGQLKTAIDEEALSGELKNVFFRRLQSLHLHRIAADENVFRLGHAAKLDPRWGRLQDLRDFGAAAAGEWLATHGDCLGVMSSIECSKL